MTATTRPEVSVSEPTLSVAFELSAKEWKLAITSGFGIDPWLRTVAAGDVRGVERAISQARLRFRLAATTPVVSCYEAGRDGFWIHRALTQRGIANRVVDSASIEVDRRARRAKTDRIDAMTLVRMLVRAGAGERDVWREVRVPTVTDDAARQVSRERTALIEEQTRLVNQIRSWLATWGCRLPARRRPGWWTTVRDWAQAPLPGAVQARIGRAEARLTVIETQIAELEDQQAAAAAVAPAASALGRLVQLKGVATTGASVLLDEGLIWRAFRNRREIGGRLGFAPTPYQSGEVARAQGISRAGNARLQAISIQLAWNWVRWQPTSALTQWYRQRFAGGGKRLRRIGIVAVARKLVIALWRYATTGVVPTGAIAKGASIGIVAIGASHARCARIVPGRFMRPPQRRCRSTRVRIEMNSLWGRAPARVPDRRRVLGHGPTAHRRTRVRKETDRCTSTRIRWPPTQAPLVAGGLLRRQLDRTKDFMRGA